MQHHTVPTLWGAHEDKGLQVDSRDKARLTKAQQTASKEIRRGGWCVDRWCRTDRVGGGVGVRAERGGSTNGGASSGEAPSCKC